MRVSYDKDHRKEARATGKRLYTFQITGPGGGGSITSQGFYTPETLKHIKGLIDAAFAVLKEEEKTMIWTILTHWLAASFGFLVGFVAFAMLSANRRKG